MANAKTRLEAINAIILQLQAELRRWKEIREKLRVEYLEEMEGDNDD